MKIVAPEKVEGRSLYGLGLFIRCFAVCLLLVCCVAVGFCCFDRKIAAGLLLGMLTVTDAALLWLWRHASRRFDESEDVPMDFREEPDSARTHAPQQYD